MQIADAIYPLFLILWDVFFITHKLWQKTELNFVDHFCFFDDKLDASSLGLLLTLFPTPSPV